jgi:hypothetical protein
MASSKMNLIVVILLQISAIPIHFVQSSSDSDRAREYYDTAFNIAKQTGDFWVAEKVRILPFTNLTI